MPDEKLTRTTGALLVAMQDHVEQLIGGNHVDPGQLRLTIAARQIQAKALVGAGLSLRETAKKLGVDKRTVGRDVGHKAPNMGHKAPPKLQPPPPKQFSDPEEERKQQRWAATRNLIDGILLFDRHRPGAGAEMAAAYDPDIAASYGENITPERIRNAIVTAMQRALHTVEGRFN